ncbi:MAG TPA: PHP domain-containing protein [Dehalococcoidia bacterium]|nr:PHP domain-containing protein [Dehalococcoidia bacterium]
MSERRIETNQDLAELLSDVAVAYKIRGLNRFEAQAYDNAAAGVEHATRNARELWQQGALDQIAGVGKGIASYLDELFRAGHVRHFDEVMAGIPEAVFDLVKIPGVGPATAQKLAGAGVEDLRDLEMKLASGGLAGKGFSTKALEKLSQGLGELQRRSTRMLLPAAEQIAAELLDHLRESGLVIAAEAAGSLRRRVTTIGDLDLAAATEHAADLIAHFVAAPGVARVVESGPSAASVMLHSGVRVDLLTSPPHNYGALLHHFTGSKQHNIHIRTIARQRGLSISELGVLRLSDGVVVPAATEAEVYDLLEMQTPPPELREDAGEIEAALNHALPELIGPEAIRADCHTHTRWSDGTNSMAEMVAACRGLGREYMVITDHSYPNLDFAARSRELDALRATNPGIRLIDGLEVNITSEGGLQVPDAILSRHEYCIGSIHSSFRQPREVMTARLLAALASPYINGIAHPTGRLINQREGIDADWSAVMAACLRYDKFLEIDGWPDRLDLPDGLVREAVGRGVKLVIDSDAHATDQLPALRYGVDVARRGWAAAANVLNTLPYEDFVREAHLRLRG